MLFASSAVRVASRQALSSSSRRQFSSVAQSAVKQGGAKASTTKAAPIVAAAGLTVAAMYLQQREVRAGKVQYWFCNDIDSTDL